MRRPCVSEARFFASLRKTVLALRETVAPRKTALALGKTAVAREMTALVLSLPTYGVTNSLPIYKTALVFDAGEVRLL